jgi:hypothetical protein
MSKDLIVSGISKQPSINLKIMVLWRDYAKLVGVRESFLKSTRTFSDGTVPSKSLTMKMTPVKHEDEGSNP